MTARHPEIELDGLPLSPGVAVGPAFTFKQIDLDAAKRFSFPVDDIEAEINRLDEAIGKSRDQLAVLHAEMTSREKKEAAQIFSSQKILLEDEGFLVEVKRAVASRRQNAEYVLAHRIDEVKAIFSSMEDEVFRIKTLDIQDVFTRLLRNLFEIEHVRASSLRQLASKVILVADKFLPSDIVLLEKEKLLGIVLEEGSTVSHVAIIARSLGVPAIINVSGVTTMIHASSTVIADGYSGKVIINPAPKRLAAYRKKINLKPAQAVTRPRRMRPCTTRDGRRIALFANAGSASDVSNAIRNGAEGVGLVRSELFYLALDHAPSIDEETAYYRGLIDVCGGRPLTVRLLDIGGDKSPPYLVMPDEDCPQLGERGIRYLLKNRDLFRRHLRAVVRACKTSPLHILIPFVSLPNEIDATKSLVDELCKEENTDRSAISIGAMIEVPSAALSIASFVSRVDFLSIGTNDLVQYLFAASRENGALEPYRASSPPLLLGLIRGIASCAAHSNKPLFVCGEMASQSETAQLLVGAGVTGLSVQPSQIPAIHRALRKHSFSELQVRAEAVVNTSLECRAHRPSEKGAL
jgi:phosphoenolpyruvate-protein phosphotransferase